MIYTVTFNPSLDHTIWIPNLTLGDVNRATQEQVYPGGKGINVSVVLKHLGLETTALGFRAGFTGQALEEMLHEFGCHTDLIPIEGFTRINVKIKSGQETDINSQGPAIPPQAQEALLHKLDILTKEDLLVLAGSIPNTMPNDAYEQIMARLDGKGIRIVVDATGDLLTNVLPYRPFLMKPNHLELGDIFEKTLHTPEEVTEHAKLLQKRGARNVLVSLGKAGAVLVTEDGEVLQSLPPEGNPVNAVGSGDSMVAGFLYGYLTSGNYREAFRMGLCAGSATAFQPWLATREQVEKVAADFQLQEPVSCRL